MNITAVFPTNIMENHIRTIHQILGREPEYSSLPQAAIMPPVADLPVAQVAEEIPLQPPQEAPKPKVDMSGFESRTKRMFSRDIVRYPLIFLIALGFFYGLLNFRAVSEQLGNLFSPPPKAQKVALAYNFEAYTSWIKKYYVYVSDSEKLGANEDPDGDGLTNLDEFSVNTNPLNPDTDGDGFDDGREVLDGYNPLYQGKLLPAQLSAVEKNLDKKAIEARRVYEEARGVAGTNIISEQADDPIGAATFTVDETRSGLVEIPKLNINVPLIWNTDFSRVQEDLKYGVVHHPLTALPGEVGMVSIHGHSSGYPWDGDYKNAFTKINFLESGDEAFVTVYGVDGESRRYRYIVRSKKTFAKDDAKQFEDRGGSFLNLSTSWPVGTARERYVVTTELAGI